MGDLDNYKFVSISVIIVLLGAVLFLTLQPNKGSPQYNCTNRTIQTIQYVPTYLYKECPKQEDCFQYVLEKTREYEAWQRAMNYTID